MYHTLASSKEVMKKDYVVLEKKYKRSQQKIKSYDNELKQTRQQVSTFKLKFKSLTEFIKKKGGLEMLNSLPNAPGYLNSNNNVPQQKDLDSLFKGDAQSEQSAKITIRGKAPKTTPREEAHPTIRGGGAQSVKSTAPPSN